MKQDEIIRMAIESGAYIDPDEFEIYLLSQHCFEDFAALVAAHEREACAKVCEETPWSNWFQSDCAAAIRARSVK